MLLNWEDARAPWTARRSSQSVLQGINHEYSLERLMLKLKLQQFSHLMLRADLLEKILCWEMFKARGEGDDRGCDGWMASLTQCTWVWVNCGSWWWTGKPGLLQSTGSQRVRHNWVPELMEIFKRLVVVRGFGERKWGALLRHSRSVGLWNYLVWCYNGGYMSTFICNKGIYMIPLSKLMEYITQRVNSNYEILLIMYQYWLISLNKHNTHIVRY